MAAAKQGDVQFAFTCDTKQGALLSYTRSPTKLDGVENLEITQSYVHFTCKDSNFRKTGDESNAASCFGTGFLNIDFSTYSAQYSIQWFTYYTNGVYKEIFMRVYPIPTSNTKVYVA